MKRSLDRDSECMRESRNMILERRERERTVGKERYSRRKREIEQNGEGRKSVEARRRLSAVLYAS